MRNWSFKNLWLFGSRNFFVIHKQQPLIPTLMEEVVKRDKCWHNYQVLPNDIKKAFPKYQQRLITFQLCLYSTPIQEIKHLGHFTGYTVPNASIISSPMPWKHTKLTSQNLLRLRIWCPTGMRSTPIIKRLLIGKRYVEQCCPMLMISCRF